MSIFSFGRKAKQFELELRFHKEANFFGEHGTINVSHIKQNLVEKPVRFVFVGITTPPKLDRILFNFIWEEAKAQGYTPHHLLTYGKENEIDSSREAEMASIDTPYIPPTFPGR